MKRIDFFGYNFKLCLKAQFVGEFIKESHRLNITFYINIFVYNIESQKNQYILINNKLFTIYDTSNNLYNYSSNIFIDQSGNNIDNTGSVSFDDKESYLIYSTNSTIEFIDHINGFNTFATSTFTSPYKIYYKINQDSFYFKNRLCPVNFVKNSIINLDTYNNLEYNFCSTKLFK